MNPVTLSRSSCSGARCLRKPQKAPRKAAKVKRDIFT
jgi:hypothetical protein